MLYCEECSLDKERCICNAYEEFIEENQQLMEDLAELEAKERPNAKRCISCYFFNCRCIRGLNAKKY